MYNKEGNYIEIDINAGLNNIFKDLHTGMTAVLGHELTHWMQVNAPTEYLAYKKAVLQAIMSTKNGELRLERMIEAQIDQNKRDGKEITRSEAEDEVVADASMKRMGDTEFWDAVADNLGEKKADVAARIRDYISKFFRRVRELLRKASHTSEAARIVDQAEAEVQANLRKLYAALTGAAMRNSAQTGTDTINAATKGGKGRLATRDYTLSQNEVNTIQSVGGKSVNDFTTADIKATETLARMYWNEMGNNRTKSPFFRAWFGDWRLNDATPINDKIAKGKTTGSTVNNDTGWKIGISGKVRSETNNHKRPDSVAARKYLPYIESIIQNAILVDTRGMKTNKAKSINSLLMHNFYAVVNLNGTREVLRLLVEEMNDPNIDGTGKRAYELQAIEKAQVGASGVQGNAPSSPVVPTSAIHTVADLFAAVKYYDKDFHPIVPSRIVNQDGKPKTVFHQTAHDFWTFNTNNPVAGKNDSETPNGIFFKDNDHDIGIGGSRQIAVYLDMKNPLHFANRDAANKWYQANIPGYSIIQAEMQNKLKPFDAELNAIEDKMFGDDVTTEQYDAYDKQWDAKLEEMRQVEDLYRGKLRGLLDQYFLKGNSKYDGIILDYDGHRYVNGARENVKSYIIFQNTQVKSATDNIGTFDRNNPDIRYSTRSDADSTGRELSEGQQAYFKDSKAVDNDGNLLVLYRGKRGGETVIHGDYRGAIWTTTDPEFADRYGVKDELYANIKNPYFKTVYNTDSDTGYDIDKVIHDAKSGGHDGAIISFVLNPGVATGYVEYAAKNHPNEPASEILKSWTKSSYMDAHEGETIADFWKRANEGPVSQHVVVFSSEQVKRTDNLNPTENPDIRYATRDYSDMSDLDLLLNAADEISEGGGEDYWTSLLESNPGLAGEAEEIKRLGKQLRDTEAKLAEARRNLTLTDRKLRTRGISTLAATIMQDQKAGDSNKKDVKNRITSVLTEAYQKALDQLDAGADVGTAWDTVYNEGVVKAADILLSDATHAEKIGYKQLGEGAREYVEADIASRVAQDFDANRYRPGQKGTVADRLVAQAENRVNKKLDAAKAENATLKAENASLTEAKDFYKEQAETAKATAGDLYQQLLDKREELKNNKKISADERKATLKKLDNLERQMKAKRREAEVWKSKAEIGWKAASQAIRERDAAVEKLEKQLQRERDILSGKLKPPAIQSMLKAAREREAERVTQHKDEVFARYKERKSETALRGRIKNLHDEMNRDLLKPREGHFVPQNLIRPVVELLDMVNTQTKRAKSESAQAKIDAINAAYDRIKNDERYSQYYDETVTINRVLVLRCQRILLPLTRISKRLCD